MEFSQEQINDMYTFVEDVANNAYDLYNEKAVEYAQEIYEDIEGIDKKRRLKFMKNKYPEVEQRRQKCIELYDETGNTAYAMEEDSIQHLYSAGGFENYEFALDFCKENGFQKVYDIGSAFGHQSQVFLKEDIDYVGISDHKLEFFNPNKHKFIVEKYPFPLNVDNKDNSIAISMMCIGWAVYMPEGYITLNKQFERLAKDFNHCLVFISNDKIGFTKHKGFFDKVQILKEEEIGSFVYYSNE